jgi:hypothetical protein
MILPIVEVRRTIAEEMEKYREVFLREKGFEHIKRYVSGLILSANKTLTGIHDVQVWEGEKPTARAMHEAVFEARWSSEELIKKHKEIISEKYKGKGRTVISLDWTQAHHERGTSIYGVTKAYDYVKKRESLFQTVVTAVISNRERLDGLDTVVQQPSKEREELAYLANSTQQTYKEMEKIQERLLELMHFHKHKLEYKKRTEIALEMAKELEASKQFPNANYAFDNGVLTLDLTEYIEKSGKHWVSEIESSRNINWEGKWLRVDEIALGLRNKHRESFRPIKVKCRNGEEKKFWVFTKVVRLKKYGRKRLAIVHEQENLGDNPRFLLTDALHWESGRIVETWSYRWASEVFHEFGKQVTGFESSQVRKEEAVTRHFRLSCVSQSLVQSTNTTASKSDKFSFANGQITFGQKVRSLARQAFASLLSLAKNLFAQGQDIDQVLEFLIPA